MFEIETMTTVRVLDMHTLAAKNREQNDLHGAQLLLQVTFPIAALAMFDATLPAWLARKAPPEDQGGLEGIEKLELTEIGKHVKRIPWVYEQTGCTVEFDRGLGGSSNLKLSDCLVHRVSFKPSEGASVTVQWCVDAPSLTDAIRGKLSGMKAVEVPMTQLCPDDGSGQREIEDVQLTPAQLRAANAKGLTMDQARAAATPKPAKAWPFPQDGTPGSGPDAQSTPTDATDAVLADVAKNGPKGAAKPRPAAKKTAPAKKAAPKRKPVTVA